MLLLPLLFPLLGAEVAEGVITKLLTDTSNKHNLSSGGDNIGVKAALPGAGGTDEICVFCHTPHGTPAQSILWNRPDPQGGPFLLYGSPLVIAGTYPGQTDPSGAVTRSQYQTGADYPNGASKMCLSCHDGVTATIGELLTSYKDLGTSIQMINLGDFPLGDIVDLATSHPISFVYTQPVVDDINGERWVSGPLPYQLPSLPDVRLDGNSRMQCTTCHDPHDDNRGNGNILLPFWRHTSAANAGLAYSDVCNDCHVASTTAAGHGL